MDVNEWLSQAWNAVRASGVPEPLQELALKEALDFLRSDAPKGPRRSARAGDRGGGGESKGDGAPGDKGTDDALAQLAHESGEKEEDIRDILQVGADGKIHVTPPTKNLGSSAADQARTVIALVASARGIGLGENPVNAEAVREECERKRCYQQNNFASSHLGKMKGFNAGANRNAIVLTSKWVDEFKAAVAKLHGRSAEGS